MLKFSEKIEFIIIYVTYIYIYRYNLYPAVSVVNFKNPGQNDTLKKLSLSVLNSGIGSICQFNRQEKKFDNFGPGRKGQLKIICCTEY